MAVNTQDAKILFLYKRKPLNEGGNVLYTTELSRWMLMIHLAIGLSLDVFTNSTNAAPHFSTSLT
jgi:hypothetical protein